VISVIVPFRNSRSHFSDLLESLMAQQLDTPWEIVLVDNGSTDGSRDVAEQFAHRLPLRIVDARDRSGAGYARNVGVRHSSGSRLLFVDADDAVGPGYVAALAHALERHSLVTSRVDSTSLNPVWVREAHGSPWQAEQVLVFYDFLPAPGINIGIERQLFERVGGFPPEFRACEDIAFAWRVHLREQVQPAFVGSAVYHYRYRATLYGLFTQNVVWGASSALLYRRFRGCGMPGRPARVALREWRDVTGALVSASDRSKLAPVVVRLGACVGRLVGSARYRVLFF
jgi:glycosyltransferase involved in cell wall biosynthesis